MFSASGGHLSAPGLSKNDSERKTGPRERVQTSGVPRRKTNATSGVWVVGATIHTEQLELDAGVSRRCRFGLYAAVVEINLASKDTAQELHNLKNASNTVRYKN